MYEAPAKAAQGIIDQRTGNAMNNIVAQHALAQQIYNLKGQREFMGALASASPKAYDTNLAQARQGYMQGYDRLEGQPMGLARPNATESSPVVQANTKGYAKTTNKGKAANAAYGDAATQVAIANMLAQARSGLIRAMAQNSASSLPAQMQQALTSTDPALRDAVQIGSGVTNTFEMYGQNMANKGMNQIGQQS
jgi:hypothetical protein